MKKPLTANAMKHLSYPGRKKPECWKCVYWTGNVSAGQIVCGLEISACAYRRAEWRLIWKRRRAIPGMLNRAELKKIDDYNLIEFQARCMGHFLGRMLQPDKPWPRPAGKKEKAG
jgi:hypothetical protein